MAVATSNRNMRPAVAYYCSPIPEGIANKTTITQVAAVNSLCAVREPVKKYPPVYEEEYADGHLTILLRPACLPYDLDEFESWFHEEATIGPETKNYLTRQQLTQLFNSLLLSDKAQLLTGMLNNNACFMAEVCRGDYAGDWLGECAHQAQPGDYFFRLIMAPPIIRMRVITVMIIHACLNYFFSFPAVERIIWELSDKEMHFIQLAGRSGFGLLPIYDWPEKKVYQFSKEMYAQLQTG